MRTPRLVVAGLAGVLAVVLVACDDSSDGKSPCDGVSCPEGQSCVDGACIDPCASVTCDAGETCDPADLSCRCGTEVCIDGQVCDAAALRCRTLLPDACKPGSRWVLGVPAFREATADRGLDGVEGVRISVADVDGDGFADLSVRRAGTAGDDFAEGGRRVTWLLRNDGTGRFTDVTRSSGIVTPRRGDPEGVGRPMEVAVFGDVDNDGDLDVFSGSSDSDPAARQVESSELLLNEGDGSFVLGPEAASVRKEGKLLNRGGAAFVDADRDGVLDLWLGSGAPKGGSPAQDELHLGEGDGSFYEITGLAGLRTADWTDLEVLDRAEGHSNAWSVAACDLNDDGAPELLAASYGRAPNHLWVASPAGGRPSYRNASIASGYAFDHRVDWRDNESARCWCKHHPTDEDCAGVPEPELIRCDSDQGLRWVHATDRHPFRLGGNSGTTVCADVDADGDLDLLTTEIVHWDVGTSSDPSELLLNTGEAEPRFERPGNDVTGLARAHHGAWNDGDITGAVFDFDNDGKPDVWIGSTDYPGTRGFLFRGLGGARFVAVPSEDGIDSMAAHGVGVADFDRDGDLDVLVGHSRMRCEDQCYETPNVRYFENVIGSDGNWVQLRLVGGEGTNRAAIGARVTVVTPAGPLAQEVGGGHGHYGIQHDLALHYGLGEACEAEVTVRWPDAGLTVQRFTVQAGRRYVVVQGELPVVE